MNMTLCDMNRILYRIFLTLAATVLLAACVEKPFSDGGGKPRNVTFSVGLHGVLTKAAPVTSELDDASGTFQLYVAVFNKADGSLAAASRIGGDGYAPVATLDGGQPGELVLSLPSKREYKVIFFAQRAGAYDVHFADGAASFSFKGALQANDASLDAFWTAVDVSPATQSYDVTLRRPFAQLNVLVPAGNVPSGQETFRSTMTVKAPTSFDFLTGAPAGDAVEITFAENAISAAPFGKYADAAKPYRWVGMNYVLVPASGQVEVTSFQASGMNAPIAPGRVPVRANGRTNLVGNIYDTNVSLTLSILVDATFEEDLSDLILVRSVPGCYLGESARAYVAGADQYVRMYDGHSLTFVLLNPDEEEQLAISGYADTMKPGDALSVDVLWKKGPDVLMDRSSVSMAVVKDEDGLVWLADRKGEGFVIKK